MINPGLSKTLKTMKRDAVSPAITTACSTRRLNLKQAAKLSGISYPTLPRLAALPATLGSLLDCHDHNLIFPAQCRLPFIAPAPGQKAGCAFQDTRACGFPPANGPPLDKAEGKCLAKGRGWPQTSGSLYV
jgi:hypothetical protein